MPLSINTIWRFVCVLALSITCFTAIADDADESNFPSLESSYLKTGDFVSPDHVKRIRPGLSKDQVRLEIGNPHFSEGLFAVHVWNYAFNFYSGKDNEYVTCQFRVNYDSDDRVTSTRWKNPDCNNYISSAAAVTVVPTVDKSYHQRVTLSSDGLFAFGKYDLNDLTTQGREKIDGMVAKIKQENVNLSYIVVTGHTDRIGTETANFTLSKARAETIRKYLAQQGLDDKLIRAYGAGASQPVIQCPGQQITPQLVQCLQPNRRVEIEVVGET